MILQEQKLFIGLGTGRCGTSSLRTLVDAQLGSFCFHELRSQESAWNGAENSVSATIKEFEDALTSQSVDGLYTEPGHKGKKEAIACTRRRVDDGENIRVLGDIAFYYLNYVEFIQRTATTPVAFICMRRPRAEVIASYVRKMTMPNGVRNHWIEHPSEKWLVDEKWDKTYPSYPVDSLEAAIGRYYDDYMSTALKLEERHANFAIFNTDALNDKQGQQDILAHIGFDKDELRLPDKPPHMNAST